MSEINRDVRYLETHEWVRDEGAGEMVLGISDHAQEQLGDIVYVELPQPGQQLKKGEVMAVVESVKAASDVYAPCDGEVVAVNEDLEGSPQLVNADPYGDGWFCKIKTSEELNGLLEANEYSELIQE